MKRNIPVIDPSEIMYDKSGSIKEETFVPIPWHRFLARFFDYSLWLIVLKLILVFFSFEKKAAFIPWEFLSFLPVETLFLMIWGKTMGKHFLKISLQQGKRRKLSLVSSCRRSFGVWFRGAGMMVPFFNCVCMLVSYYRLQATRSTSWDKDEGIVISHQPIGQWRIFFSAIFSFFAFLLYYRL